MSLSLQQLRAGYDRVARAQEAQRGVCLDASTAANIRDSERDSANIQLRTMAEKGVLAVEGFAVAALLGRVQAIKPIAGYSKALVIAFGIVSLLVHVPRYSLHAANYRIFQLLQPRLAEKEASQSYNAFLTHSIYMNQQYQAVKQDHEHIKKKYPAIYSRPRNAEEIKFKKKNEPGAAREEDLPNLKQLETKVYRSARISLLLAQTQASIFRPLVRFLDRLTTLLGRP